MNDIPLSIGGMIVTEDNQSNWIITRPSATRATANTTRLQLGLGQGFSCDRPVINRLSHGMDAQDETTDKYLHQWICSWGVHGTYALFAPYKIWGSFIRQTTLWSQYGLVKKFLYYAVTIHTNYMKYFNQRGTFVSWDICLQSNFQGQYQYRFNTLKTMTILVLSVIPEDGCETETRWIVSKHRTENVYLVGYITSLIRKDYSKQLV
jgi:hypothetical protein